MTSLSISIFDEMRIDTSPTSASLYADYVAPAANRAAGYELRMAACAAASLAMGTRNGEHDT
jgi:hypothetical protein